MSERGWMIERARELLRYARASRRLGCSAAVFWESLRLAGEFRRLAMRAC